MNDTATERYEELEEFLDVLGDKFANEVKEQKQKKAFKGIDKVDCLFLTIEIIFKDETLENANVNEALGYTHKAFYDIDEYEINLTV